MQALRSYLLNVKTISMELSNKFQSERMAVNYALELSDLYRDFFFYVFRRNDGTYLVDPENLK